ncbi:Wadjet anti-phage system protein JetD domain-containing protein [Bdellovibrio reynosensis]|uniref:DUF2220 domain-containing protein n=1 Tax=Bdellovibrio reynosensis TaxID=2835041 RepID=A0ABY4CDB7_9BACT|nr:Wadjet anti-phage system protein JetD domain-containing protein [Bdellovibrio reynosensis]UOF02895.1 DUF2220 domain-containing protein [Bdellovibrio reynosensis]
MIFRVDKVIDSIEKSFLIDGIDEFTCDLRLTEEIRKNFTQFEQQIRGYQEIEIVEWRDARLSGMKTGFPSVIKFGPPLIYRVRPELKKIRRSFESAISVGKVLDVKTYVRDNYSLCKKNHEDLQASVLIAEYIVENREIIKGLLPRQIAHGQSTKLLADNPLVKGLLSVTFAGVLNDGQGDVFDYLGLKKKPISFQFFANKVSIRGVSVSNFYGVINEINAGDFLFDVKRTIIVENEESFHPLAEIIHDSLVIFGGGWRVAGLKHFSRLLPGTVFYWGDIDSEGIEILNGISSQMENVTPVAMDQNAITYFGSLIQTVKSHKPSVENIHILQEEYVRVCKEGIRIEQEQIEISYVVQEIERSKPF